MANENNKKFLNEDGLKHLVDILKGKFSDVEGRIPTDFYTKEEVDGKIPTDFYSKDEVDSKIANTKSEILGGAGKDYDTLKELEEWVKEHQDLYAALVTNVGKKANADDVYTKEKVDELLEGIDVTDQLKDYAKKTEVTSEIAEAMSKITAITDAEIDALFE